MGLTPLQRAIMDFIAARDLVTAEQVRAALHKSHPLTDSSVRTLLRRLEARGLLSHVQQGKVFHYRAETSSTRVAAKTVRKMIDTYWGGSSERFLTGLVDEKVLAAAELERLARRIRSRR